MTLPPLPATRLITDPAPRSGAWQMAVDQWMLEQVVAGGRPMLRWYRWSEPTVSLGHFQASLPPEVAERFQGLAVVRRLSGGGAILHHHELTYAVALPAGHPWADEPRQLYDRVHAAIVDVLQRHELPVTPRGEAQPGLGGAFLCFSRGDSFDLVWQGHKVLGSAQRRRKGAVLQHGSLLLTRSPHAPEFPGLTDLAHPPPNLAQLAHDLETTLAKLFAATATDPEPLQPEERSAVQALLADSTGAAEAANDGG